MTTAGEIIRSTLFYSVPNASVPQNVFYHLFGGPSRTDAATLDFLEVAWGTTFGDIWADLASTNATMDYVQCDVVNGDGTIVRSMGTVTLDVAGQVVGGTVAAATSGFIMANTALPKVRGRKYLPGMGELRIGNGIFDASALDELAAILAFYLDVLTASDGATWTPGVLSRVIEAFVPFDGTGLINDIPAYQRRRKPGVGS